MKRIAHLDGWRALAVTGVLVGHFVGVAGLNAGRLGVEMFFVLSGRLMAEILFVRGAALPTFYARRASRIFPALSIAAVAILVASRLTTIGWITPAQFVSCVTMTYNYAQLWIGRAPPLDHLWSLCVEEHVYLLLGLLALVARRTRLPVVPTLFVLIGAAWTLGLVLTLRGQDHYHVYWRSDVRGASILVGAVTFLMLRRGIPAWLAGRRAPVTCAVLGVVLATDIVPDPIKYSLGTLALAGCVGLLDRAPARVRQAVEARWLGALGLASYSIYLWQQPFYTAQLPGSLAPVAVASVLAIGWLSYRFVEEPARAWLNGLLRRAQKAGPAEEPREPISLAG
jgi:peptidoglycan/LPS O-acetylase OafA/YrhL